MLINIYDSKIARTFDTEQQAKQWFQNKYTDSVEFSGFHQTQRCITNWVCCKGKEIGEIAKRFYDHD